jgi:hypothetical protein
MSELTKLPKDLRSIVLDYVGRRMYPPLEIEVRAWGNLTNLTVSIYGDSFKVVRDGPYPLHGTQPATVCEPFTFFVSCRDQLLEVLCRRLNEDLQDSEEDSLPWLSMIYYTADESIIHEISYTSNTWPGDKPHLEKSTLKHMVDLLWILYVIV